MTNPRKQSTSPWLSYLLMGGILTFGAGAAALVLSGHPGSAASSALPKLATVPAAVRAAVAPALRAAPPAAVATPVAVALPAPAAADKPQVSSQAANELVPVAATAAPAAKTAPIEASVTSTPATVAATQPAKDAPAVPAAAPVSVVASSPEPRVSAVVATPPATRVVPRAAPAPKKAVPPRAVVAPRPRVVAAATAVPVPVKNKVEMPAAAALPPELPLKSAGASSPTDTPVESRPTVKSAAKPENKATPADTAQVDASKPTVKSVRAAPLVPAASKPTVVMANGEKAWVKLDDQRTVIVTKGQDVPGLGTFQGADKGAAKFDSGNVPLNQ